MRVGGRHGGWVVLGIVFAYLLVLPALAQAAQLDEITLFTDPRSFTATGTAEVFTPANSTLEVTGTTNDLKLAVTAGSLTWNLEFAAPAGMDLQPGVYDHAQRAS